MQRDRDHQQHQHRRGRDRLEHDAIEQRPERQHQRDGEQDRNRQRKILRADQEGQPRPACAGTTTPDRERLSEFGRARLLPDQRCRLDDESARPPASGPATPYPACDCNSNAAERQRRIGDEIAIGDENDARDIEDRARSRAPSAHKSRPCQARPEPEGRKSRTSCSRPRATSCEKSSTRSLGALRALPQNSRTCRSKIKSGRTCHPAGSFSALVSVRQIFPLAVLDLDQDHRTIVHAIGRAFGELIHAVGADQFLHAAHFVAHRLAEFRRAGLPFLSARSIASARTRLPS